MRVAEKVAVVTGGGGGIGGALAARLVDAGARVVVADIDGDAAANVAAEISARQPGRCVGAGADVADPEAIAGLLAMAEHTFGPVEMYFANAGIAGAAGLEVTEADWDRSFDVNVRAHIRAAQQLIPRWVERGEGYFVTTASAAGLLTQIGSATYSVTKHAAVGFAEWLSVTYGDKGIRVSCLCPMGVDTPLLYAGRDSGDRIGAASTRAVTQAGEILEPAAVADAVMAALETEQFLILPHASVLEMYRRKGADYDRWLAGMRRYQSTLLDDDR